MTTSNVDIQDVILNMDSIGDHSYCRKVETRMLDYDHVSNCTNIAELKEILRVLVKGEMGRYPHLEKTVADKIIEILPTKEKNKVLTLARSDMPEEIDTIQEMLNGWVDSVKDDKSMNTKTDESKPCRRPIRGISATSRDTSETQNFHNERKPSNTLRISKETLSNKEYFQTWDKFDVEAAEDEINDDCDIKAQNLGKEKWMIDCERARLRSIENLEALRLELKCKSSSQTESGFIASLEKSKGNDHFQSKEYEQAVLCYSRSLAYDDRNAVVYANRAMACIKLSNLCHALSDCISAIEIDPSYTKAIARKGMIHHKCGRFAQAKLDFSLCLKQDPNNMEYVKLLKRSSEKLLEDNNIHNRETRTKISIIEDDSDEDRVEETRTKITIIEEDDDSDEDVIEEVYTPGALMRQ